MIRRLLSFVLLVWLLGFIVFAIALPQPREDGKTDGVIVLTGGEGRIDRGLEALRKGWAGKLLVAGVDREVRPKELAILYHVTPRQMACCVTLGYESVDTRSNAREAARWIAENKFKSVRLITTDWHMRRAAYELRQMAPPGLVVIRDAVPSHPAFETLFVEYNKLIARRISQVWGG